MSMLVAVDGVLPDLGSSTQRPDGISLLVGEPVPDEEGWRGEPERSPEPPADRPD
jgi:hypothetical protein